VRNVEYHPRQVELAKKYPTARAPAGDRLYTRQLNINLDASMHDEVMELADKHRVNVAEMVRTLIQWGLDQCD
jgi:hypothetical protein